MAKDENGATPPRKRRAKQDALPGMQNEELRDLIAAADEYVAVRDERMDLTKKETEASSTLLRLMHEHKLESYVHDGLTIEIEQLEKVKVRKPKDAAQEATA